jgi:nitroreductase
METWDAIRARRNVRQYTDQRVLGFPDGYLAVYLIGLGYPAGRPLRPIARPDRRPFDEVVHWDHW